MIGELVRDLLECASKMKNFIDNPSQFTADEDSKAKEDLARTLNIYILANTPKYWTTELRVKIFVPGPTHHTYYEDINVPQLVIAPNKESARKAVEDACKKEYPDATILEIRVNETLIGK